MSRVLMHVDFDYFFAQVEERENPAIKDKPTVICVYSRRGEDSGVVSTANYIARNFGVKSGIPIIVAKKRLQHVESVFLPVNHVLYDEVSEKIMKILRNQSVKFEQVGIDEAFLDVTERVNGSFEKIIEFAKQIKREISSKERITCSIGIGPNKLIAKIASARRKPDGLTMVRPKEVKYFLSPLPVRELVGVGRKTEKTLQKRGIKTIGELASQDIDDLISLFGITFGTYLHNAACGIDESPVEERGQAESISRITTLKENTQEFVKIMEEIDKLAEDVHLNTVDRGLGFKSVSIIAVMEDLSMLSRSTTFQNPTKSLPALKKTAETLLKQLLRDESRRSVRRIGIKIFNLMEEKGQKQLTDFLDNQQNSK